MSKTLLTISVVAAGGALGSVLRYGLSGAVHRVTGGGFPWGTMVVNLVGSFMIGFLWDSFERAAVTPAMRTFIFIGILGAFTTFSTYTLENVTLLRGGELKLALVNVAVSNAAGIALVFAGFWASRYVGTIFR